MFLLTLLAFVVILGLLIFVHEFGHFIVAKLSGIQVDEFAFGFPPKIFCVKRGETKYCINLIPFGGYVKMLGEEKNNNSPRSFSQKKPRVRFAVLVAGVVMNFILAGFLMSVGYMIGMSPLALDPTTISGQKTNQVLVAEVLDASPAQAAGIKSGDIIEGYAGINDFSTFTRSHLGETIILKIDREGQVINQPVTISTNSEAPIGVSISDLSTVKLSFFKAIYYGFKDMVYTTGLFVLLLYKFILGIFKHTESVGQVAGPIGIFQLTGTAVKMGLGYLIKLAAILSINLGLINFLPLPALDGGRGAVVLAEGIFGRKVIKAEFENMIHYIGFIILVGLMVAVTVKEVVGLL